MAAAAAAAAVAAVAVVVAAAAGTGRGGGGALDAGVDGRAGGRHGRPPSVSGGIAVAESNSV